MKKFLTLVLAIVAFSSCDVNDAVEFTATTNLNRSVMIGLPQSDATAPTYNETVTQDLNDVVTNYSDITNVNVDALSYTFKNVTGDTSAIIQSATIVINGTTVSSLTNVNIAQDATDGTVYEIIDTAILDQLETIFLNNPTVTIQLSGTGSPNTGVVDFEIEVSIQLTVSI